MGNGKTVTHIGKTGMDSGKTGIYFTVLSCMPRKMGKREFNLPSLLPLIVNSFPEAGIQ